MLRVNRDRRPSLVSRNLSRSARYPAMMTTSRSRSFSIRASRVSMATRPKSFLAPVATSA